MSQGGRQRSTGAPTVVRSCLTSKVAKHSRTTKRDIYKVISFHQCHRSSPGKGAALTTEYWRAVCMPEAFAMYFLQA